VRGSVVVGLAFTTWWAGEDQTSLGGNIGLSAVAAVIGAAIVAALSPRSKWVRIGWALVAFAVAAGSHIRASDLAISAFNDCVERGEDVRTALALFRGEHGHYPAHLAELRGIRIPGRRWLRPNLLNYRTTASGYDLWFGDWLVTFTASEGQAFLAHK
jgi:hypothetical protein